jgi:ribosomal protein S27E
VTDSAFLAGFVTGAVECYYPDFLTALAERERHLPACVQEEFEAYLKCGRLEHGFLRVRCTSCHAERLVAFSCKLDLASCEGCSGSVRVIASIEDPTVIGKILAHREALAGEERRPAVRGPPDPGAGRHHPLPGRWREGLYSAYPLA